MKLPKLLIALLVFKLGLFSNFAHGNDDVYIKLYQIGDYFVLYFYGSIKTSNMESRGKKKGSSDSYYYTNNSGELDLYLNNGSTQKYKKHRGYMEDHDNGESAETTVKFDTVYYSYEDTEYISLKLPVENASITHIHLDQGYDSGANLAFIGITSGVDLSSFGLVTDSDGNYSDRKWKTDMDGSDDAGDIWVVNFHLSADVIDVCEDLCDVVSDIQQYFDPDKNDESRFSDSDWDALSAVLYAYIDNCGSSDCDD
ncbi:hypothetical protein [Rubellicoccus peritrichatus]|uniref:Uncharacterized protein n=1 Tax=Rubellicoccus peritrichatus TaxID=3080537 RepID=A0AAQ3L8H0_9BACT|nr:hypothetical protein [Puniceicoccus sp. CR14]WOO39607.1 hypothetical protein RZN69_13365 [Puniceicoccus sp. CR14]